MSRTMMFLIAMGLSIVTALLLWSYTEEQKKKLLQQYQTVEVVVAADDIPARTRISADMLATEVVPMQFVQPGAIFTVEDVVGKISLVPIKKGSQILSDLVVSPDLLGGLSAVLERGTRAVTIRVDAVRGVGGMIQPGDFVDVFAVLPDQQNPERSWVVVPFQNLQVAAVGGRLRLTTAAELQQQGTITPEAAGAIGTITLMVDPQTARDLVALNQAAITILSLRPVGDLDSVYLEPVQVRDIIAKYKPRRKYRPRPRARQVELYVGVNRKRYKVVGNRVIFEGEEKGFRPSEPTAGGAPAAAPPVPNFAQVAQQVLSQLPSLMGP